MRIQRINYTTPAFGYNKELSNELNKRIEKDNSNEAKALKQLNNFCNNTENELRSAANSEEKYTLYQTLINPKLSLANLVELKYPDMNYCAREKYSYETDAYNAILNKKDEDALWMYSIGDGLIQVLADIKERNYLDETDETDDTDDTDEANEAGVKFISQNNDSDIVEKYIPNEFSPKNFDSLGGMENLKEELYDKIIYPTTHPEEAEMDFEDYGKRPPRGVMLYGPPGCGKTTITEALSQEADLPLYKLKISKAGSPYINATSLNYQKAFDYVAKQAKETGKPCFMLIDEIDGLTKSRDDYASAEDLKQMGTLLNLIETARDRNIFVIAATNKYDIIDPAIKRRFDEQIYIPLPDQKTREQIIYKSLAQRLKGIPLAESEEDLAEIAEKMAGFPSSAIVIITDKASDAARKDGRRLINKEDFFNEITKNENLKIEENGYKSERKTVGFKRN